MQRNRSADIDKLIQNLDITPAMYLLAKQRYEKIASYFTHKGIDASFYPQGSFRLGTVIRPLRYGQDDVFDLDVIGELHRKRDYPGASPEFIKTGFGDLLKENSEFSDVLQPEDSRL